MMGMLHLDERRILPNVRGAHAEKDEWMTRIQRIMMVGALVLSLCHARGTALEIGAPVPDVVVAEWMQGEGGNPAQPDGTHIYVVEFWATWCGPCLDSIPHLNDLKERYKDKGVRILGITNEPRTRVEPFLEQTPIHYDIGLDTGNRTSPIWLGERGGIPQAFVVDQGGVLLWRGHPMGGLDYVLGKVVEGSYTKETAVAVARAETRLQEAVTQNNIEGIERAAGALIELEPDNPARYELMVRVYAHLQKHAELRATMEAWRTVARDTKNAASLLDLAETILGMGPGESHDPLFALEILREALAVSETPSFTVLAGAAELYAQLGAPRQSLALLARAREGASEHQLADIEILTTFYIALATLHDAEE